MKSHNINNTSHYITNNFIGGWYIKEEICDLIVLDFENRKPVWKEAHSIRGYNVLTNQDMNSALMSAYKIAVSSVLGEYKKLYPHSQETIEAFYMTEPWNIQKYDAGKHYSAWHCENNGNPKFRYRHLAFMTYLNTVTDGGETEFLHQNVKIKPERGLTLVWPAHFTHIHCGLPSHTQEKYVTTGWFEFFDTENFLSDTKDAPNDEFFGKLNLLHSNVN